MRGLLRSRPRPLLRCAPLLLAGIAATCQPPPDLDGEPGGAHPISFGERHPDQLHCQAGDCADWYRVQVPERGDLLVRVESPVSALEGRSLVVVLADGRASQLDRVVASTADSGATLTWQVSRGHYMVRVEARDDARTPLPYELTLRFVPPPAPAPPPPPPAPRFETVSGEVLELEGAVGDPEAVLVDRGERDGVRPGQRGRLVNGDESIATIEVVDTYPEGSRARIEALSGPILPETRVEIDVPIGNGP